MEFGMDPRIKLGRVIRDMRISKKWTQEDLAEAAEMHPTYISSIETGKRNVSILMISKIAGAFDITIAELMERAGL